MRFHQRLVIFTLIVVVALCVVAAVLAVVHQPASATASPTGSLPVTEPSSETVRAVPALGDPRGAEDRLDPRLISWRARLQGASEQTARLLHRSADGERIYVVASADGACLVSTTFVASGCSTNAAITSGSGLEGVVCSPYMAPGELRVYGLLPRGTHAVRARYADGSTTNVQVDHGLVDLHLRKSGPELRRLEWGGSDGRHVDRPLPPGSNATRCDTRVDPVKARAWALQNVSHAPR